MGFAMPGSVIMRAELKLEKRAECAKSPVEILFFPERKPKGGALGYS